MSKCNVVKLKDIVIINPSSINKDYPFDTIEYLDISSVGSNIYSGTTTYTIESAPSRARRLVKDGDTIISTVRPNLKVYLKIKQPVENLVVSTGFAVLRPTKLIDPNYLFYSVTNQTYIDYLSAIADSKTTSYPAVDTDDIRNSEIALPSFEAQQKVGTILSAYDELIDNNNRRIAILEELAQRLYREWFIHFRFPGHENVKMVESEIGLIPEGWKVSTVGRICEKIFSGGTPTTTQEAYWGGTLPWLSSGETRDKFIVSTEKFITEEGVKNSSTRLGQRFDIVVASAGQGKTRGQTSLLLLDTYINQSVIAIRVHEHCIAYTFFNISSRYDELRHISDASSIRGSLTTQILNNLPILLPEQNLLQRFNSIIMSNILCIENLRKQNENLRKTRNLLLPRLISGDIDVSELDIAIERNVEDE